MSTDVISLQEKFAANSICYGCGPANPEGLHIKSFPDGDGLTCIIQPDEKYHAFPGFLYGGIVGCLFDCHCNWTASWHLMQRNGLDSPPCTVTAQFKVTFQKPTPMDVPLTLKAKVVSSSERKAEVQGELFANNELCAACEAIFVSVKPGHPAYHRW